MLFVLLFSLAVNAKGDTGVANVDFGTSYDMAITKLKQTFGEPAMSDSAKVVFMNRLYDGDRYDKVEFYFEQEKGDCVFNQARFYIFCTNKNVARQRLKFLSKVMGKKYEISYDEEDGGDVFYKGGTSPLGYGKLFTIFTSPMDGRWTAQLRFGPFKNVKR